MDYKEQKELVEAAKKLSNDYERAFGLYDRWLEYNWEIFDGVLDPLVVMVHSVSAFGSQGGHYSPHDRKIFIWDKGGVEFMQETLLHEMAHQWQDQIRNGKPIGDCHNCSSWCDVWNEIILPKTGHGKFCVTLRKRTKRLDRQVGKQVNIHQLVWVPSCEDRTPVPYDVVAQMGHPHLYRPATEEWAKGCGPKVLEAV